MIFRSMALGAALLLTASTLAMAATSHEIGSCTIKCDQKLASCERIKGRKAKCPQQHQSCVEYCSAPPKPELRSRAKLAHDLCTQRCDLNLHTCLDGNGQQNEQCRAGQANCIKRCN